MICWKITLADPRGHLMQTAAVARPHLLHIRSSFFLLRPMVSNSSPDYKALFLRAEEGRKQAELRQKQATAV